MQTQWNHIIAEIRATSDDYLLAVSGGVDSIFMLRFMAKNSHRNLRVAHFNHGLREQSVEEEELVRQACRDLGLELHVGYGDPAAMYAAPSLEAEARRQRYAFFDEVKAPAELIVTAHHANDQLETILLRLMRGYPHDSLRIQKHSGDRYRPFLDVPKEVIVEQATRRGYRWLEDSSNHDDRHERNWVRNVLVPQMSERRNILKSIVYSSRQPRDPYAEDIDDVDTEGPSPDFPKLGFR